MPETILNYVGGKWTGSETRETFEVSDPATAEVLAKAQKSSTDDVREAIEYAAKTRENGIWANNPRQRALAMLKLADMMEADAETLSRHAYA